MGATIRGILTNPAYIGQVYLGRTRMHPPRRRRSATQPVGKRPDASQVRVDRNEWLPVATIPPIMSQSQFDLVQAKLARNIQTARRNNTTNEYLLRALVSCGRCQLACTGRADDCGHNYYVCRAKAAALTSPRDEPCRSRYIPARRLDDLVWEDLCKVITHPEVITHALERAWAGNWLPQELQARRENLRKGRKSLDQQIERLTQAYLSNIIQLEEFQRRRSDLEEKRRVLEEQEQQLQAQVERKLELAGVSASIENFCQRIRDGLKNATFEKKRQLVELLIDRVVVTNEEVEVRYVIPTGPDGEKIRFCHLHKDYFNQILPGSRVDAVTPRGCRRASPSKPDWTFSRHPAFRF
jgi:site-specific DNA recombinase